MKQVELTEPVGSRQRGDILNVDDASAVSLVETRKVATYVRDTAAQGHSGRGRRAGGPPAAPAPTAEPTGDTPGGDTEPDEPEPDGSAVE